MQLLLDISLEEFYQCNYYQTSLENILLLPDEIRVYYLINLYDSSYLIKEYFWISLGFILPKTKEKCQ